MDIKTVRREVTTMANRINRKFHNLSMSFRKAWAIVKCKMLVCKEELKNTLKPEQIYK